MGVHGFFNGLNTADPGKAEGGPVPPAGYRKGKKVRFDSGGNVGSGMMYNGGVPDSGPTPSGSFQGGATTEPGVSGLAGYKKGKKVRFDSGGNVGSGLAGYDTGGPSNDTMVGPPIRGFKNGSTVINPGQGASYAKGAFPTAADKGLPGSDGGLEGYKKGGRACYAEGGPVRMDYSRGCNESGMPTKNVMFGRAGAKHGGSEGADIRQVMNGSAGAKHSDRDGADTSQVMFGKAGAKR